MAVAAAKCVAVTAALVGVVALVVLAFPAVATATGLAVLTVKIAVPVLAILAIVAKVVLGVLALAAIALVSKGISRCCGRNPTHLVAHPQRDTEMSPSSRLAYADQPNKWID